jgi:hypothetical protein
VPVLIALILVSLVGWAMGLNSLPNTGLQNEVEHSGNVIMEEYGSTMPQASATLVAKLLAYLLLAMVVLSALQYGVIKGFKRSLEFEEYSIDEVLEDGIKHAPGVILINILGILLFIAVLIGAVLVLAVLAVVSPVLALLLGVPLVLVLVPLMLTYFTILVPAYVEEGELSVFIDALRLVFKNAVSSIGFGLLMLLFVVGVAIAMAPVIAITTLATNNALLVALIEAPFSAFIQFFTWGAGLMLYLDFTEKKRGPEPLY